MDCCWTRYLILMLMVAVLSERELRDWNCKCAEQGNIAVNFFPSLLIITLLQREKLTTKETK